jgi:hypothetical protein
MPEKTMVRGLLAAAVLALANFSAVHADTIQFTDSFNGSTLDPWWNANVNVTDTSPQGPGQGYITYPSSYLGVPCVQLTTVNMGGNGNNLALVHDFSGMTYGDASVWFYDTGAGLSSSNYIGLGINNSVLASEADLDTWDYDLPGNGDAYNYNLFLGAPAVESSVYRTQAWHHFEIDDTAQSQVFQAFSASTFAIGGVKMP